MTFGRIRGIYCIRGARIMAFMVLASVAFVVLASMALVVQVDVVLADVVHTHIHAAQVSENDEDLGSRCVVYL